MDVEISAEAKDKRLNRLVAVTVVVLSVFMGLCNIKDGNIVQNMAQAKADSVDRWGEYQATRTKVHIVETARATVSLLPKSAAGSAVLAQFDTEIAKYKAETPGLAVEAKRLADRYDALNVHDDQFDASDALISTAISLAAVAALSESFLLLFTCWGFATAGLFMGVCGFAGFAFHPDVLSNFLG